MQYNLQEANKAFSENNVLTIKFDDDEIDSPELDLEIQPQAQQKLSERHFVQTVDESGNALVKIEDLQGLGIDLVKYVTGYRGFLGEINKKILKESCEKFPTFSEKIAMLWYAQFKTYQQNAFKQQEEEKKT